MDLVQGLLAVFELSSLSSRPVLFGLHVTQKIHRQSKFSLSANANDSKVFFSGAGYLAAFGTILLRRVRMALCTPHIAMPV